MKILILILICAAIFILSTPKPTHQYVQLHQYFFEIYDAPVTTNDIRLAAERQANKNPQYDSLYITREPPLIPRQNVVHQSGMYSVVPVDTIIDIGRVILIFHFCSPKIDNSPYIQIEYDSLREKDYLLGAH